MLPEPIIVNCPSLAIGGVDWSNGPSHFGRHVAYVAKAGPSLAAPGVESECFH